MANYCTSNFLGVQYSQYSDTSYVALWRIIRIFNSFRCIPLSISVYTNRLKGTNCTYHRKGMTITYVKKRLHNDNFSQKLNGLKSILIKDKLIILTVNSWRNVFAWNKYLDRGAEEQMVVHCHVLGNTLTKQVIDFTMSVEDIRLITYLSQVCFCMISN